MPIFSDADLQDFGDLAVDLALVDSCELWVRTEILDDTGGGDPTYTLSATVACAVVDGAQGAAPTPIIIADQDTASITHTILLPRLTTIHASDQIVCDGAKYEVVQSADPTTYEVLRRVRVTRKEV